MVDRPGRLHVRGTSPGPPVEASRCRSVGRTQATPERRHRPADASRGRALGTAKAASRSEHPPPPARPQGTKAKRTTRAYCRIPASDDAPVIGIHERGLFVKLSLSGIGWLWGGVVCGAGQQAARAAGEGRSGAVLSRLVGDADRAAGAVGCSVVVSASAQESRATAARAARHSFACGDCMKPSGALGVQGRGAIHFLDRTGWWVMPFPGPHEDCCVTPPRRG